MTTGYDYIVVGAGSAGAPLAARLSEGGARVLLLEAGERPRGLDFKIPVALTKLWFNPAVTWSYMTEPEPGLDGRRLPVPRGRVLGGTSAINGMVVTRGAAQDYDRWEGLGLPGWGYADVLPYFKRVERNWRGATPHHGGHGPLPTSRYPAVSPYSPLAFAAAEAIGFSATDDFCGPQPEGFGFPDFSIRRGRRVTSADAYLTPARARSNLTVETGARVLRVLIEAGRAVGVEVLQGGQARIVRADREVLLCGGAIASPQLLLLSGIGPADELRAAGIAPAVDLPGVGRELEDQPAARFALASDPAIGFQSQLRFDRVALSAVRWFLFGTGPLASLPLLASFIVRTRPDATQPDMRLMVGAAPLESRIWFPGVRAPARPVMTAAFSLCHPKSRGWVKLASADPLAQPRIAFNLLTHPEDLAEMRRGYRMMREMLRQPSLAAHAGEMVQPATEPNTDAEVDAYLRAMAATTFHPIGSCRMGTGEAAVVDGELRVRGVEGLRVVDTSIFPTQIGGNPNVPAMMIAEKAADLMLGRPALDPAAT